MTLYFPFAKREKKFPHESDRCYAIASQLISQAHVHGRMGVEHLYDWLFIVKPIDTGYPIHVDVWQSKLSLVNKINVF